MKYVCKRENALAFVICAGTTFIAFGLAALGIVFEGLFRVFELISMLLLFYTAGLFQKHVISSYEYILDGEDELLSYNRITVVRAASQKKTSLVCTSLKFLTYALPEKDAKGLKKELKKKYGKIKILSFCTDIRPKNRAVLVFEYENECVLMRLQCGEDFISEIEKRAGV